MAKDNGVCHGECAFRRNPNDPVAAVMPRSSDGNVDHENISGGKADDPVTKGFALTVRGVAHEPVDHPMGGV
jgi:hypothetical protein